MVGGAFLLGLAVSRVNRPMAPGAVWPPARPERQIARERLERVLPRVHFEETRFSDAMAFFGEATGTNVEVNWRALEAVGIGRDWPVTLDLPNVSAKVALRLTLRQIGGESISLRVRCVDSVVLVSTEDELAWDRVLRVYEVSDLVNRDIFREMGILRPGHSWMPDVAELSNAGLDARALEHKRAEALIRLIEEVIDPTSWSDAGGSMGRIYHVSGWLVVIHTPEGHEMIDRLLSEIREQLPADRDVRRGGANGANAREK
jgi:hypothetical protein